MTRARTIAITLLGGLGFAAAATASHIPGGGCADCASHRYWPTIDGVIRKAKARSVTYRGTSRSDELLGHHRSDAPRGQPAGQRDAMYGAAGSDFIYGSHGHNTIYAGAGNDVISVHYGRGLVDCGPGRDVYHVARSRKRRYRFRNCEKADYRPEQVRGGPLKPLD
jgi:hypothetical protein